MSWGKRMTLWLLCMLAALMVIALDLLGTLGIALTDRRVHEHAALDSRVTAAQLARIEETVETLAAKYHFAPETVMAQLTEDTLHAYSLRIMDWWMGLIHPDAMLEMPQFETGGIRDAVLQDEQFREYNDADVRKLIARDNVAYEVGQAVRRAVFPLRQSILDLVLPRTVGALDMRMLWKAMQMVGVILLAALAVLLGVIVALSRSFWRPLLSVLTTSAAVQTVMWGVLRLSGFPAMLSALNPILGLQADIQLKALCMIELLGLAVLIWLGLGLRWLTRRREVRRAA